MPFAFLLAALADVPDPRRPQGQRYSMSHLLLFSVLATLAGATSYQKIIAFIVLQRERLNVVFGACFRRTPAVNTLRHLFLALGRDDLEAAFRRHACDLSAQNAPQALRTIALDGKTLRGSFDHLTDRKAVHVLSAFASDAALVLAHQELAGAPDEVAAVPTLMALAQRDGAACDAGSATLDPVLRAEALAFGERLPALWADPDVSCEHRKALLRCLIDKVVLRRSARDAANVRVVWRGGEVSELTVTLAVNALAALPRGAEMKARVLELARAGMHDEEIAQTLSGEGHRSPWQDKGVLPTTVHTIRLQHGIKAVRRCTRWPRVPGWLTVTDVAAQLQVPERWLRERLWAGAIQTMREPSGRYLFPDKPETLEAPRQLRAGTIKSADLTKSP